MCGEARYSYQGSTTCDVCASGYTCAPGSTDPQQVGREAMTGQYSVNGTLYNCPAGTYGNKTGAVSQQDGCIVCEESFYCLEGSTPYTKVPCPTGAYCPRGTSYAAQYLCPSGRYNSIAGKTKLSDCLLCRNGTYCGEGSSNGIIVPPGYFGPPGTEAAHEHACPAGRYSSVAGLYHADQCLLCERGHFWCVPALLAFFTVLLCHLLASKHSFTEQLSILRLTKSAVSQLRLIQQLALREGTALIRVAMHCLRVSTARRVALARTWA